MFGLFGWGIAFPAFVVAVGAATWASLDAAYDSDYPAAAYLLLAGALLVSGAAFVVGYMLRDA